MRGQKLSKIHFLILLSLLGFISPLQSQEYKFRTLGVEDGLSQITVSDICQDEKSRIWIATLDGLNCFDGNHIKVFNHFHNDSISYGNLYVTQMVEDGQGSLFLLTSTGLFQFDLETEKYYILPVPSPSTLAKGKLGVWIAEGGKLFLYDKNTRSVKPMYGLVRRIMVFSVFHLKVQSYIIMIITTRVFTRSGMIWQERYVRIWKEIYG